MILRPCSSYSFRVTVKWGNMSIVESMQPPSHAQY